MSTVSPKPSKYAQLAERLRSSIAAGTYPVGERLPPFTALQQEFGITQKTLEQALGLLEKEGLIERRWRSGVYVSSRRQRASLGFLALVSFGIVHDQADPFWAALLTGVRNAATDAGLQTLLIDEPEHFRHWEKVDGILVTEQPLMIAAHQWPLGVPRVSLLHQVEGLPSVVTDDAGGARQAVRFLLDQGHRKIAFLGVRDEPIARRRLEGYRAELKEAGIAPDPEWCYLTGIARQDDEHAFVKSGRLGVENWREQGARAFARTGCTAILVQSDPMSVGVLRALRRQGFAVPEDISLISFDGTEVCQLTDPRITSVTLPLRQVGETGARLLLDAIKLGRDPGREVVVLPATVDERESTGRAPVHAPLANGVAAHATA